MNSLLFVYLYIGRKGVLFMNSISKRERLIQLAMCGCFTSNQLFLISEVLEKEDFLSLEEMMIQRNILKIGKKSYSLLEKVRKKVEYLEQKNIIQEYQRLHIHVSTIYDIDYPLELREIYHPPAVLFYQGNWDFTKKRKLGIVGSRENTTYGVHVLSRLLPELIQNQVVIVSGLAAGIDREAHIQTILLGGQTISVIGTGLDYFYPKNNKRLQEKISTEHLLISEYPLGSPPLKYNFPMRNRIIAGLSHGTLVIEAKQKSGSLITANVALQENREVFAVPGNILENSFQGTNQLIQAGAKLVLNASDILQEMNALWNL